MATPGNATPFPLPLESYGDSPSAPLWDTLVNRIHADPFNLVATFIFLAAIIHSFLAPRFLHLAHDIEERHKKSLKARGREAGSEVSFAGQMLHFVGEIEAVFGIWAVVLAVALTFFKGWATVIDYVGHRVNFTEAMFVVVIMAISATRPVVRVAETCLSLVASLGGRSVKAWWLSVVILAPLLGSFITEPAAMTIGALLLSRQFYSLKPAPRLAYATLGLFFVNISVGGTLTHFAAPPVLMVAGPWKWDMAFMFLHFGWRAFIGILISTTVVLLVFYKEFGRLEKEKAGQSARKDEDANQRPVPLWVTSVQIAFLGWTVFTAHYPALFIGGFLFFLAFSQATAHHQSALDLRPPLLVGFFLAGLVIHGGLQGWWIEPLLVRLGQLPLFFGATVLTAFNDNAAITYLATLVKDFGEPLKYAVVAGAVTGGGLTVIANAPNPAGQSLLQRHFGGQISPVGLFLGALGPTLILGACFLLL